MIAFVILIAEMMFFHSAQGVGTDISCFQKPDGFYPNPISCEEYYVCTMQRAYRFVCQPGLLYNSKTSKCEQPEKVQCYVIRPSQTTVVGQISCAGKSDNFYPSPDACDQYYICANQSVIKATCSYGLLFSSSKKYCDLHSRVLCLPGQTVPLYTTRSMFSTRLPIATTPVTVRPSTRLPVFTFPHLTSPPPVTQRPGSGINYGVMCRNKPNSLITIPGNCGEYLQCYFQLAMVRTCPSGTVFNEKIQACDYNYNVPGCH